MQPTDGIAIDGIVDLVFDGTWLVIDFKTDHDLERGRHRYENQVAWYAAGYSRRDGPDEHTDSLARVGCVGNPGAVRWRQFVGGIRRVSATHSK